MVAKAQNPISCSQSFEKARHIQGKKIIILAVKTVFMARTDTMKIPHGFMIRTLNSL
jgi:hypothetical protein